VQIIIQISEEEKLEVLKLLKKYNGKQVSVAKLAEDGGLNPNRTRFVFLDLLQEDRIERIVLKDYGPRYRRYAYKIKEDK